jgi:hypothetical protein
MAGTWATRGSEVTLQLQSGPNNCTDAGRYTFAVVGARVSFNVIADACAPRRMILDRSEWSPAGVQRVSEARRIVRGPGTAKGALPPQGDGAGHWPSFRGHEAAGSAEGQHLPDGWSPAAGTNILWQLAIPGLAHSSPIVWGDLLFVTSAVSGRPDATFKPGLYGDGDASDDRSAHRWMLHAIDKRTDADLRGGSAHRGERTRARAAGVCRASRSSRRLDAYRRRH